MAFTTWNWQLPLPSLTARAHQRELQNPALFPLYNGKEQEAAKTLNYK